MTRWSDVRIADISRAWDASAARQPRGTRANGTRADSGVPALCDGRRGQSIIRKMMTRRPQASPVCVIVTSE